jgi:FSR family fosmidomycin resistance protein-like MFS transporter
LTASLLQPLVGIYTDRRPKPFSLATGMGFTLVGLLLLSRAYNFPTILLSAGLVGVGSSIFHPESSRLARVASGGRHGFAQSLFQVGGNFGTSLGPLMAAFVVHYGGQPSIAWFSILAMTAIVILFNVGRWYQGHLTMKAANGGTVSRHERSTTLSSRRVAFSISILLVLIFSKHFYLVSISNYYTFDLIDKFDLTVQNSQICLFVFLFAVAAGTIAGGPIGDRFGFKFVIWCSILGVLPFTLILPYANLFWTVVLTLPIGFILASAFPAILVYAQELLPGRVGMIAGLFFGFAFGIAGLGAAVLGRVIDFTSIGLVYKLCSFLPMIGLLTAFLPNLETARARMKKLAKI